jgi:hypothetical protein
MGLRASTYKGTTTTTTMTKPTSTRGDDGGDDGVECDCCGWKEDMEYTLIWVNAEGFEPLDGEVLKDEAYEYDALCEECYNNFLVEATTQPQRSQKKF